MRVLETAIIYVLIGLVVAASMWGRKEGTLSTRLVWGPCYLLFWPFFAPELLARNETMLRAPEPEPSISHDAEPAHPDLEGVESRLMGALDQLDGVAEVVVDEERERVRELLEGLRDMRDRLEKMDRVLESPEFDEGRAREALESLDTSYDAPDAPDPKVESLQKRLDHIEHLQTMRDRLRSDFEEALFQIDAISSKIALLTFADRPDGEVSELIEDVAATVEGLSDGLLVA